MGELSESQDSVTPRLSDPQDGSDPVTPPPPGH